jgi:hypothetical protein
MHLLPTIVGDILDPSLNIDCILHQANIYHRFGGGLAAQIAKRYPEALEADRATGYGDESKLGSFSVARVPVADEVSGATVSELRIFNIYSQIGMSETSYDYMRMALVKVSEHLEGLRLGEWRGQKYRVAIPYNLGCGIADGNFNVVQAIVKEYLGHDGSVFIVRRPCDF